MNYEFCDRTLTLFLELRRKGSKNIKEAIDLETLSQNHESLESVTIHDCTIWTRLCMVLEQTEPEQFHLTIEQGNNIYKFEVTPEGTGEYGFILRVVLNLTG